MFWSRKSPSGPRATSSDIQNYSSVVGTTVTDALNNILSAIVQPFRALRFVKQNLTASVTQTIDFTVSARASYVLDANVASLTLIPPTASPGEMVQVIIEVRQQGAFAISAIASSSSVFFPNGALPVITTGAGAVDLLAASYDSDSDTFYFVASQNLLAI